jgi:hypothetical protein
MARVCGALANHNVLKMQDDELGWTSVWNILNLTNHGLEFTKVSLLMGTMEINMIHGHWLLEP